MPRDFAKAVAADAPVIWVQQDETSGVVAKDAMGGPDWTNTSGAIKGQPPLSGKGGFSTFYPSQNEYTATADTVANSITGAITLEAWFKLTAIPLVAGAPSTIYVIQKGSGYQLRLDDFGSGPTASIFMWNPAVQSRAPRPRSASGTRSGRSGTWSEPGI